ncbi:MAG: hypothetical protein N7Q72_03030, partial [Spiroplasma sp. Tabriz.8]|nr:hypothetical protein [Spiroplasma sp. Tabriz.8]
TWSIKSATYWSWPIWPTSYCGAAWTINYLLLPTSTHWFLYIYIYIYILIWVCYLFFLHVNLAPLGQHVICGHEGKWRIYSS